MRKYLEISTTRVTFAYQIKRTMKNEVIKCERCGEVLNPKKVKWLELSTTDGNFYVELPKGHESQGAFSFGTVCATNQINETISSIKNNN